MSASTSDHNNSQPSKVQPLPDVDGFQAIPFAVAMPSLQDSSEDKQQAASSSLSMMGDNGIVGSILMLGENKSAMIWVGWGHHQLFGGNDVPKNVSQSNSGFGTGTPPMGQLLVAMPRTQYKGAFGGNSREPSCSMLIGSESDSTLGTQMASRLSTRSGMAIYVSCQLSLSNGEGPGQESNNGLDPSWNTGLDSEIIAQRAAAVAEKEIWRILQEQKEKSGLKA